MSAHGSTRRAFLRTSAGIMAGSLWSRPHAAAAQLQPKKVAAIVTEYRHNSHADVIVSRLLETFTLDGKGERPRLELVSLYVDQFPDKDLSRDFAKKYGFKITPTIRDALTFDGKTL